MAVDKDQYKALFEYQKTQFEDAKNRYSKLEDKAAKYLTSLTIIISAYVLLIGKFLTSEDKVYSLTYAVIVFFIVLTFLNLSKAWLSIIKSLNLQEVAMMPSNLNLIEYFLDNELPSVYWGLSEKYTETIKRYSDLNHHKALLMQQGYNQIISSAGLFTITIFLIFLTKVT